MCSVSEISQVGNWLFKWYPCWLELHFKDKNEVFDGRKVACSDNDIINLNWLLFETGDVIACLYYWNLILVMGNKISVRILFIILQPSKLTLTIFCVEALSRMISFKTNSKRVPPQVKASFGAVIYLFYLLSLRLCRHRY